MGFLLCKRSIFKFIRILVASIFVASMVHIGGGAADQANSVDGNAFVWTDSSSGYAIGGYDPLAYYVDKKAREGKSTYEHASNGIVWKFTNSGNRDAFAKHPQYYLPAYGGFDPFALGKKYPTIGLPTIWSMYKGQVYLFHNAVNRKLWEENPDLHNQRASRYWSYAKRIFKN